MNAQSPLRFETKQSQTWRYAAASAAAKSIMELAKYFMNCLYWLTSENYSYVKCTTTKTLAKEMHYNQIVVNSLSLRDNLSLRDSLSLSTLLNEWLNFFRFGRNGKKNKIQQDANSLHLKKKVFSIVESKYPC